MSRKPSKTYEEFLAGTIALTAEGRTLTIAAIKEKLGGGSNELLTAYIKRHTLERQKDVAGGLPQHVTEDVHGWYAKLVIDAKERAEQQLESRSLAVELREKTAATREEELQRREDRLAGKEELIHTQLADMAQQLATSRSVAESRGSELAGTRQQLNDAQTQLAIERDQRASQDRLHVAERDQLRQMVTAAAERMAGEVSTMRSKVLEGVDTINQASRGLRTDIGGQLERILAGAATQRETLASLTVSISKVEAHGALVADLRRSVDRLAVKQSAADRSVTTDADGSSPKSRSRSQTARARNAPTKKKLRGRGAGK